MLYGPVIHSFAPLQGLPGSVVKISGEYFTPDSRVYYGNIRLQPISRKGDELIVIRIPKNPRPRAPLWVRNSSGEAKSPQKFTALVYPTVANVRPRRGYAGTRVTLNGNLLEHTNRLMINDTPLTIISKDSRRIVAEIPAGARSGWISMSAYGQTERTRYRFDVLGGPEFGSFYPQTARPGDTVTIEGRNFNRSVGVYLGQSKVSIVRQTPRKLVVKVPGNTQPGAWHLRLREGPVEARSPSKLRILPSPYISSISAGWVYAGSKFIVEGEHLAPKSKLYWGKTELQIASRSSDGRSLEVYAPRTAAGRRFLWLDDGQGRYRSPNKLEIRAVRIRDNRKRPKGGGY